MIEESFRSLLYSLGWAASIAFFLRFYFQWFKSEKKKKSYVNRTFWHLSLAGNIVMLVHGIIQLQFPLALIQSCNAIISWRNLNLMQKKEKAHSFFKVLIIMGIALTFVILLFLIQWIYFDHFLWMRSPSWRGQNLSPIWHFFGFFAMLLFASRFWIQWFFAEREKESQLHASFWWLSLLGGFCSFLYFLRLFDFIQMAGAAFGLLPYMRNLILLGNLKKNQELKKASFFFVAGEKSGDILGSELIHELKKQNPGLSFNGVGGELMTSSGMKCKIPMERLNVMGFSDVLKALPRLLRTFQEVKKTILTERPEKVILIDYPDFNMHLAKALRKKGYLGKIIHYVSPSVWAWRKKRALKLSKTHNLLLSIFPFEKKYFSHTSLNVQFVGHPLVEVIQKHIYKPSWKETYQISPKKSILALFPGSRSHELKKNLSLQLDLAKRWLIENSDFTIAVSAASEEMALLIENELGQRNMQASIIPFSERYELMKEADLALATSGTVTLELALHKVPTLVTYLLTPLNYFLGRYIFRIHLISYCIVNIIAEKEVYPEFIGKTFSSDTLYKFLRKLFRERKECITELSIVQQRLSKKNPNQQAALAITNLIV